MTGENPMPGKAIRSATKAPGKPPKMLESLRVIPGEKGGVNIEHHFTSYEHPAEHFPFGATEGKQALDHIAEHAGIDAAGGSTPEEGDER
jgi:hypothetical protein